MTQPVDHPRFLFFSSILSALPSGMTRRSTRWPVASVVFGAIFLLPLVYLLSKAILDPSDTVDFKYLWLAGYLWAHGIDPYTPAFGEIGQRLFVGTNRPPMFFYPPSWYLPARLLATMPYETARVVWRVLSAILIIASAAMWLRICRKAGGRPTVGALAVFYYSAFASTATATAIALGQTAPLIFFGMTLFFGARLRNDRPTMVAALCLLMLKPNLGLLFCAFVIPGLFWLPALITAAALSIFCSLPAILPFGVVGTLSHIAGSLGQYDAYQVNNPMSTTGLRNTVFYLTGQNVSAFALAGLSYVAGLGVAAIGFWKHRNREGEAEATVLSAFAVYIALAVSMISLHSYDLVILAPLALLSAANGRTIAVGMLLCLFVLIRGQNVATLLGLMEHRVTYFQESGFYSAVLVVILVLALAGWRFAHGRAPTPATDAAIA